MSTDLVTSISLTMTGTILNEDSPEYLGEVFAGTSHCGATGGILVPGIRVWQDVVVTPIGERDADGLWDVSVTATLLGEHRVMAGDYAGELVTPEWVGSYIVGAGDYLLGADVFSPDKVTATEWHPVR